MLPSGVGFLLLQSICLHLFTMVLCYSVKPVLHLLLFTEDRRKQIFATITGGKQTSTNIDSLLHLLAKRISKLVKHCSCLLFLVLKILLFSNNMRPYRRIWRINVNTYLQLSCLLFVLAYS